MPKVSVIILTFNRAELLRRALASVLDQTFRDFEIIIVDDCSSDNTGEVISELSSTDGRIKYIRQPKNMGPGASRNAGLKNASGEYIAFLDDDDEWLPEKLRLQVECLDQCALDVGAVYCGRLDVDSKTGKVLRVFPCAKEKGNIFKLLLKSNFLTLSSILLRSKCFEQIGVFDEDIPVGEDYDIWIRISQYFRFEYIDQPLVKYGIHSGSISKNLKKQISGQEAMLRKYHHLFLENLLDYSRRYYALGIFYCLDGNTKRGRTFVLSAIKMYPWNLKPYVAFCATLLGSLVFKIMFMAWVARKSSIQQC